MLWSTTELGTNIFSSGRRFDPLISIRNPLAAVCNVENHSKSTKLLASTTLRTILGTKSLSEILSDRESIAQDILAHLDSATDPWGIMVERVEVKDVRLPLQLQRAMAAEAEAAREARAKVHYHSFCLTIQLVLQFQIPLGHCCRGRAKSI